MITREQNSRRETQNETEDNVDKQNILLGFLWTLFFSFILIFLASVASAEINPDRIADAIYQAENSVSPPYGIMKKYKHTTPRQACINTIRHAIHEWNGRGDFIAFLSRRYCPVGSGNDNGTCQYWVKNVKYFLSKAQR